MPAPWGHYLRDQCMHVSWEDNLFGLADAWSDPRIDIFQRWRVILIECMYYPLSSEINGKGSFPLGLNPKEN